MNYFKLKMINWSSVENYRSVVLEGQYQWLDSTQSNFDSKSSWWCKQTNTTSGYSYLYNEPTKFNTFNEPEACVAAWRGVTQSGNITCLDDRICSLSFPFLCEKCTRSYLFEISLIFL